MLEVVDELERNGHNLQHFSRELSRYFRNLLVARIAGGGHAPGGGLARRSAPKLAEIAAQFSEEDLTRYLQLSLDLFRDLQFSLQPRFHLEIGLVRLVQAGRLLPIEQALAGLGPAPRPAAASRMRAARAAGRPAARNRRRPLRSGPSPFELDRAKKAAQRPPEPQSSGANALAPHAEPRRNRMAMPGDSRQSLHAWLRNRHAAPPTRWRMPASRSRAAI